MVYKTPALDLSIEELISRLQDKFGKEGTLDGLVRSTIGREVENELNINKQIFREILLQNWDSFFPGVSISDVDVNTELDNFIAEKRPELTAILHDYVMKRAVVAGTPSLNLLLSAEVVERTSEFPCEGKPHDFGADTDYHSSFIVTETGKTHYDNSVLWEAGTFLRLLFNGYGRHRFSCGKIRRKIIVRVSKCINCETARVFGADYHAFCESCGREIELRRIWRPLASRHVQRVLALNGLTAYHV
ncbi:MAG: hypothetical protein G01um101448_695 [Parcubacteria group bacterium Gr01-1014_48]|nr:MAG: hypothetical protein Greene041614_449 [Parcubacteria group bacterium Greene0416_14]TSC73609.1 MAG: hypothetical protein G01um101448_695 [Parcubacteria group bacterium Gr01-1014_48]TSD00983.1 MAG: hypothetical protein Greene101415_556 [Parcubacteria group bacterium Greene1014_15]TSD08121.1 MAG: hypothetical protein Greene07144_405 [Parcubacteria group bacterium Greene0714_4]